MNVLNADIWDLWTQGKIICITTNGDVRKDGLAVMGRGVALQATRRIAGIQQALGQSLKTHGNVLRYFPEKKIIIFPVKHHWNERADLKLIGESCDALHGLCAALDNSICPVYLPKPGCGNGGLDWTDVRPIVKPLVDEGRAIIVDREVPHA